MVLFDLFEFEFVCLPKNVKKKKNMEGRSVEKSKLLPFASHYGGGKSMLFEILQSCDLMLDEMCNI